MNFFKTYWNKVERKVLETGASAGDIIIDLNEFSINNTDKANTVDLHDNVYPLNSPVMDTSMPHSSTVRHERARGEERESFTEMQSNQTEAIFQSNQDERSKSTSGCNEDKAQTHVCGSAKVIDTTRGRLVDVQLSGIHVNGRSLWAFTETDGSTETNC